MIENMEGVLFAVFLFALTIGMAVLSTGLSKLLQVISFVLMMLTGSLVVSCLFPVEMEETILKFTQMSTTEIVFVVGVVIVNVVGIAYIFYLTNKEKKEGEKVQTNEEG